MINKKCKEITITLFLQYVNRLEYCNLMLRKRIYKLEKITDNYYKCISELQEEVIHLRDNIDNNKSANRIDSISRCSDHSDGYEIEGRRKGFSLE